MPAPEAPFIRFHRHVEMCPDTGCWIWQGDFQTSGYGRIKCFGSDRSAHRVAYELYKGPIADEEQILHSCDNKQCVNPAHLCVGTHADNMREAAERGLMKKGEAHPNFGRPSPRRGIGSSQARPVCALGKYYGSMKEAERALGLGSGTVSFWIKKQDGKARFVSKEEYRRNVEQGAADRKSVCRPGREVHAGREEDREHEGGDVQQVA